MPEASGAERPDRAQSTKDLRTGRVGLFGIEAFAQGFFEFIILVPFDRNTGRRKWFRGEVADEVFVGYIRYVSSRRFPEGAGSSPDCVPADQSTGSRPQHNPWDVSRDKQFSAVEAREIG